MNTYPFEAPLQEGGLMNDADPFTAGGAAILTLAVAVAAALSVTVTT